MTAVVSKGIGAQPLGRTPNAHGDQEPQYHVQVSGGFSLIAEVLQMFMYPDALIETLTPAIREANDRLALLGQRLPEIGTMDFDSGSADIDEVALRDLFQEALGPEEGSVWGEEFVHLVRDGYAVLHRPASAREPAGIFPWRLVSRSPRPELLSPRLLAEFGIGVGGTPASARAVLTQRFTNVPAEVLDERTVEWLGQIAFSNLAYDIYGMVAEKLKELDRVTMFTIKPGGGSTAPGPSSGSPFVDALNQALRCINNAQINTHVWGVEVCFDNRCGDLVANALLMGAAAQLADALKTLVGTTVGASAAMQAAVTAGGGLAGLVILGLGLYTGISMKANNTPRGVCLQAPWPITGGLVWWAVGR